MMTQTNKTYFISDIHLSENEPIITAHFNAFMSSCDASVNAIYILGDLFEAWIGDDDMTAFHQNIISILRQTTNRGIPIYLLHGNRDFLLGNQFLQATGINLIPEETVIDLYGKRVLLLHGDTLCTRDISYQKARKWYRNRIIQKIFLFLPLNTRRRIADKMREKSKRYVSMAESSIMDVTPDEVEKVMIKHKVFTLIHGHTHRPGVHSLLLNTIPATRVVLGAWHEKGSVYVCEQTGSQTLIDY